VDLRKGGWCGNACRAPLGWCRFQPTRLAETREQDYAIPTLVESTYEVEAFNAMVSCEVLGDSNVA
jgi:hypothetical protein